MTFWLAATLGVAQAALPQAEPARDPVAAALIQCAPATYDAALACLDAHLPASTKQQFAAKDGTAMAHFGLGLFMRNNWGLWQGGPLARFMRAKGVAVPDDMSGYILEGYASMVRGQPRTLDQLLASRGVKTANPEERHAH